MAVNIQKNYVYKIFNSLGVYLGTLPPDKVITEFGYNQNIQTVGTQIQIEVAQSADVAMLSIEPIYSEDGNPITDEFGNNLLIERQPDIVGSGNSIAKMQNNNLIQVWEYSNWYPNGLQVFSGYISKWKATFGANDTVTLTCISLGQDLNNYVVLTGDTASISQTTDNGTTEPVYSQNGHNLNQIAQGQNFTAASTISVGGVSIELTTPEAGTVTVAVYAGNVSGGAILSGGSIASGSVAVGVIGSKTVQKVTFNNPTTLTSGQQYYFLVFWSPTNPNSTGSITLFANNGNPYASGDGFYVNSSGTYYSVGAMNTNTDLYFIIWAHNSSTTAAYSAKDPSFILTDVMNNYIANGGQVGIPQVQINPLVTCQLNDATVPSAYWGMAYDQIFTPSKNMSINLIQLYVGCTSGTQNVSVSIYQGNPANDTAQVISGTYTYTFGGGNTLVATSNALTVSNATPAVNTFTFNSPVNLTSGTAYYLHMEWGQGQFANLIFKGGSTGETPTDTQVGRLWTSIAPINNTGANPALDSAHPYMYFSLGLLNPLPANLNGGYNNTGNSLTYTFKLQTILQAIGIVFGAAPANWYWYVDPSTNILQFALSNTVADITLIKGKHINELEIEATKEGIKNNTYFTAGDDGTGTSHNILVQRTVAVGTNRVGLALLSDNRINSTNGGVTAAALFAVEYMADNANEAYITNVTIQDSTMDTNKIKLGMMIGFAGFGNFVDSLLLQVVGIQRTPDQAILQIGTLPIRQSQAVSQLNAALQAQQVANTNATPS